MKALRRCIALLTVAVSIMSGCDSLFPQPEWVLCPSPGRYVFDLAASSTCSLNGDDLAAIEVFMNADQDWSERRYVNGVPESTEGVVSAFDSEACRLSANVEFARTLDVADNPPATIKIRYDFKLSERDLTGVASVRVVCAEGADWASRVGSVSSPRM